MTKYGCIRVSTNEQNPDRQFTALQACNVDIQNIYLDKMSGKNFLRLQYKTLLKVLDSGALLIIKSIDRLGRNYVEILEQ